MTTTNHRRAAALGAMACLAIASCAGENDPVNAALEPIAGTGVPNAGGKPALSTPTLTATTATQTLLTIHVCAGATGAPNGFTLQWIDAATCVAQGFGAGTCDAGLSGSANNKFALAAGACVDVPVGNLSTFPGPGVSYSCDTLTCGTEYAFQAFAHANAAYKPSGVTPTLFAWTLPCNDGCTYTQGYWKNHPDDWPASVTSMKLGTVSYTAPNELLDIFHEAPAGNGLVTLAHQLITAKLNIAIGANGTAAAGAISSADALFGGLVVPPVGGGYLAPATTGALVDTLTDYNEGVTGPGHCDD